MSILKDATLAQYPNPFINEPDIAKQAQVLTDINHVLEGVEQFGATSEDVLEAGFNAFQIKSLLTNVENEQKKLQEKIEAFGAQMELDL